MIKFCIGNTRIVIIFLRFLVMKIPNPRFDVCLLRFRHRKNFLDFILRIPGTIYWAFLCGAIANLSEALIYYNSGRNKSHLVPVFTIGICSFQIYQGEEMPTENEIRAIYAGLPADAQKWLSEVNCHECSAHNWRRTKHGLRLIDYASDPLRTAWAVLLRGYEHEISQATNMPK